MFAHSPAQSLLSYYYTCSLPQYPRTAAVSTH